MKILKILIVKLSALGDIVHALPVVDYIKSHLPTAEIDWVVEERFKELLATHPLINQIYPVDTKTIRQNPTKGCRILFNLGKVMASRGYDVALDLQGNIKSGIFTILSRAPLRYGFSKSEVRELPNLFATNRRIPPPKGIQPIRARILHIAAKFLEDVEALDSAGNKIYYWDRPLNYLVNSQEKLYQEKLLRNQGWNGEPLIGIIPGTTWKTKMWHLDRWRECLELLTRNNIGRALIFWGSQDERAFANKILDSSRISYQQHHQHHQPIIWQGGSLKSLIAAISLTSVVIGPDTGPLHLAALIGIPTISIYRATNHIRNAPRGPIHASYQVPLSCSPCLKKRCNFDELCSLAISAEVVINHIKTILS
jgi:heptosyltransferase-1